MPLEIERKFLCSLTRSEAEKLATSSIQIKSIYLKNTPQESLRIVKNTWPDNGNICKWTKKIATENPVVRTEIEEDLPQLIFDAIDSQNYPTVIKDRFYIKINFNIWEVDFYKDYDFVVAEMEFSSLDDANEFNDLPSWIIEEVTSNPYYLNSNLAK